MDAVELEDLEIELLVEAVFRRYGYDFRNYSMASLRRRIRNILSRSEFSSPAAMIPKMLHDRSAMASLVYGISVTVTEMFRDPEVYREIREKVVPVLKTYPFVRIWHAGCATGEEVYSMAILLSEEGLYDRCQVYATDLNDEAIAKARAGIFSVEKIKAYHANYVKAGGKGSFSEYYQAHYDSVIMNKALKKNVVFANHNLAADSSFGEVHLIFCRNVMIYFNQRLQDRVLTLFGQSLVPRGFLCLGTRENIRFSEAADRFEEISRSSKLYQKK